jgi:hypothetical protein
MKVYRNTTGKRTTIVISANRRILVNAVDSRLSDEAYNEVKKIHPNLLVEVPMDSKKVIKEEKIVIKEPIEKKEEEIVLKEPVEKKEEDEIVLKEPIEEDFKDLDVITEPVEKKEEKVILKEETPKRGRKKGTKNNKSKKNKK